MKRTTKAKCPMCGKGHEKPDPTNRLYPGYVECDQCGFQWKKAVRTDKETPAQGKTKG